MKEKPSVLICPICAFEITAGGIIATDGPTIALVNRIPNVESTNGYNGETIPNVCRIVESVLQLAREGFNLSFKIRLGDEVVVELEATPEKETEKPKANGSGEL